MKRNYLLFLFSFFFLIGFAQPKMVDGVIAVVGGSPILQSEVEAKRAQSKADSVLFDKCSALEDLLYQKLLLAQAVKDSVEVTDEQVEEELERRLRNYIGTFGSVKAFEEFVGKSMDRFKEDMRGEMHEVMLVQRMQAKITDGITVSPSEVREFFEAIPKDSIPLINAEIEVGHITKNAVIHPELKKYARDKIESIRKDILEGRIDFGQAAIINSMDPGSAMKGGDLGTVQRGTMVPEFEAAAFRMQDNKAPIAFEWSTSNANQTASIKGKLLSAESLSSGIKNVLIELLDNTGKPMRTAMTDSTGAFSFDNLSPGTKYSVRFSKILPPVSAFKKVYFADEANKIIKTFDLSIPNVSEVFETDYGYHILTVDERRGDEVDVRHILIIPQASSGDLGRAKTFLDSIADLIKKDSISLTEASSRFSDDEDTKHNGGLLTNPYTGSSKFEASQLGQIDPSLTLTIAGMKAGETSASSPTQTRDGKQAYHIIFVKSRSEAHIANLKDDYQMIQDEALAAKKNKIINEWTAKKIKTVYIRVNDEYKTCRFDNPWVN